jgi:hypothetical protein
MYVKLFPCDGRLIFSDFLLALDILEESFFLSFLLLNIGCNDLLFKHFSLLKMKQFFFRNRAKMWNENLLRLQKFPEDLNSKNQQRSEMLMNERSGGSNFLKMGTQIHRNPSDLGTQRLEDRTKTIVLNKRVRSSVAESRVCTQIPPLDSLFMFFPKIIASFTLQLLSRDCYFILYIMQKCLYQYVYKECACVYSCIRYIPMYCIP